MRLLEIKLENPIGQDEIIRLRSELIKAKNFDFLIIDTGLHNFSSIRVHQQFKHHLDDLEPCLTKFKKIAIIRPRFNKKKKSKPYKKLYSRKDAINWFKNSTPHESISKK